FRGIRDQHGRLRLSPSQAVRGALSGLPSSTRRCPARRFQLIRVALSVPCPKIEWDPSLDHLEYNSCFDAFLAAWPLSSSSQLGSPALPRRPTARHRRTRGGACLTSSRASLDPTPFTRPRSPSPSTRRIRVTSLPYRINGAAKRGCRRAITR